MCDTEVYVVEGTATNLFACIGGVWKTPLLDRCGVAGTMRQQILNWFEASQLPYEECRLRKADIEGASALFLSNAMIGVWPVTSLEDACFAVDSTTHTLVEQFAPTLES